VHLKIQNPYFYLLVKLYLQIKVVVVQPALKLSRHFDDSSLLTNPYNIFVDITVSNQRISL